MTSSQQTPTPLWSAALRPGVGPLAIGPDDSCIVSTAGALAAFSSSGGLLWETSVAARLARDYPIISDGSLLRFEDDTVVARSLSSGKITSSFAAPSGSLLALTPWDDLVYTQPGADGSAIVQCVTRAGGLRWSVSLERPSPLFTKPIGIGEVTVFERRGALWAFDRDGHRVWIADHGGLRNLAEGEAPAADGGDTLGETALRVDDQRALVQLKWTHGSGLYLLDASEPSITPIAVPCPAHPPFRVAPHADADKVRRFIGLDSQIDIGHMDYRFPVVCFEQGGARLWSQPLEAKAIALRDTPEGAIIATANPTSKRWRDYAQYYDLSLETFVCCIAPDGTRRWIWNSKTPITHLPVVSASGTVYVGTNQQLLAFATV